ncbi:MAG TPA: 50S ribosomal protein L4 [Candidatus Brocadiia bacterium]|nr:50S ribosomal protein L4 [Candidatus Brocadiia bacterium]
MIEIPVYSAQGQAGGKMEVDEKSLGGTVSETLLREAAYVYESNQRVGTRHVKNRSDVEASTRKLYRQKHTGNARAGSRSTNIRRGGGKAHAPQAQDWRRRLPRRALGQARRSALLARLMDGEVLVVEALALEQPSTKTVAGMLKGMGVDGSFLLVVEGDSKSVETVWKSARNIAGGAVRRAQDVNALDLLSPDRVIFTRPAFEAFMKAHTS